MSGVWFTSDTHFYHEAVIGYSNRPYGSLEEMHEGLIDKWNAVIRPGDTVYHLGDFALTWKKRDQPKIEALLSRLNGQKHLIVGNHDREAVTRAAGWCWVGDTKYITVAGQKIVLFHYAIRSWRGMHRGSWHLYGHSHGSLPSEGGLCMDVGVDCHEYWPVSFDFLQEWMRDRTPVYVDHHRQQ